MRTAHALIVTITIIAMLLVAGCAGATPAPPPTVSQSTPEAPTSAPTTGVEISVLTSSGHTQLEGVWKDLPAFEQQTGIKVNLVQVPTADIPAKALTDARLGTHQFDVIEAYDHMLAALQPHVAPIEDFLLQDGVDLEAWKSQQVPWAVEAATWDGKVTYWPYYSGAYSGFYRKELFESPEEKAKFQAQYGYELPAPPQTMQELLDVAEFFTRDTNGDGAIDHWGMVFGGSGENAMGIFHQWSFQAGLSNVFDAEGHLLWGPEYPKNQPIVADAARALQDLVWDRKVAPPDVVSFGGTESFDMYTNGQAAMLVGMIYFFWKDVNDPALIDKIGKTGDMAIPGLKPGEGTMPFWWVWAVANDLPPEKAHAAWQLVKWLTERQQLETALTKGQGVFVPTDIATLDWAASNSIIPPSLGDVMKKAKHYNVPPIIVPYRPIVQKYVEKLLLNEITPEEFVAQSAQEIETMVAEQPSQ